MFQFIVTNILMISVGTILYLVIRTLPRIGEEADSKKDRRTFFERWATSEIPERFDTALNAFLGKFLRKLKVFLLKIDNFLTNRLKKIKVENGKAGSSLDHFKEIAGEKSATSEEKKAE